MVIWMEFDMLDEYPSGNEDEERYERMHLSVLDRALWEQV